MSGTVMQCTLKKKKKNRWRPGFASYIIAADPNPEFNLFKIL